MASRVMNPFQKVFNLLDLDIFEESGLPKCSVVKNPSANVGDMGLIPGLGRSPEREMATHLVFLPGKSHGKRSLVGYSSRASRKSQV